METGTTDSPRIPRSRPPEGPCRWPPSIPATGFARCWAATPRGLSGRDGGPSTAPVTPRSKANYIGSDIRERNDDVTDIHFAIGFESFGAKSADSVALMVMQTLLGEWNATSSVGTCSSSELCRTVAEPGLAQQVSAFSTQYSDTGLFGVYGVGHKDHITDLIWATQVRVPVNAPCR